MKLNFVLGVVTAMLVMSANVSAQESEPLTIGSVAPKIDVEHWIQDGDGKFEEVTSFEEGNVYLVEFWATWCGPCIASMPHISETQQKYADKGFQVISISDEDVETVDKFLERSVPGEDDLTFQELTSNYCLTTDPDGSVQKDYMEAAGQNGIPTAFLVGKTGHIEWIGHPMEMDKVLEEVVNDVWDRDAFAAEFKAAQKMDVLLGKLGRKMQEGKADEVIEDLGAAIEGMDDPKSAMRLREIRLQVMLGERLVDGAAEELAEMAKSSENAMMLNNLSWAVVEMHQEGDEVGKDLIAAALDASKRALSLQPEAGYIMDTVAHLEHMAGNLDAAIELMEKAVETSGDEYPDMEDYLKVLKEEKEKADK